MIPQGALLKDLDVWMRAGRSIGQRAGEGVRVPGEQRRNRPQSSGFTGLQPRPRPHEGARPASTGSQLLGLQVQGLGCALQPRPCTGSLTSRVTPQEGDGGEGRLALLSSLKGRLESTGQPANRSRTGSRPQTTPGGGAPAAGWNRDSVSEAAGTTAQRDKKRQLHPGHPADAKVSQLHLYLPSSLCDDEEQETDSGDEPREDLMTTEDFSSGDEPKGGRGQPKLGRSLVFPNPSHPSGRTAARPLRPHTAHAGTCRGQQR